MAKPIHTMIPVLDIERSIAFYDDAFGMKVADRFAFEGLTLCYLRAPESDFEIELTLDRDRPYAHGDGYGHVAFVVDDLEGENARSLSRRAWRSR